MSLETRAHQGGIHGAQALRGKSQQVFDAFFIHNHLITMELHNSSRNRCNDLGGELLDIRTKDHMQCHDAPLFSALETRPTRNQSLRSWFAAKDDLRSLSPTVEFRWCESGSEAWNSSATEKLGFVAKMSKEWIYSVEMCNRNGIIAPTTIASDDDDKPTAAQHKDAEDMATVQRQGGQVYKPDIQDKTRRAQRCRESCEPAPGPRQSWPMLRPHHDCHGAGCEANAPYI